MEKHTVPNPEADKRLEVKEAFGTRSPSEYQEPLRRGYRMDNEILGKCA
jgi:hypothetical protein